MPAPRHSAKSTVPQAWAPASLIERYVALDEELTHGLSGEPEEKRWQLDEVHVRLLLISDDRMKRVWNSPTLRVLSNELLEQLVMETVRAVHAFGDSTKKRTKSGHRQHFDEVAKQTRALTRKIENDVGKRSAGATAYLEIRHLLYYLRNIQLPPSAQQSVVGAVKMWLENQHWPTFTHVLRDLEEATLQECKALPLLRKPGANAAMGHYLALRLNAFFRTHLNRPLHEQVTTITNVVTRLSLEPDTVRKLCSDRSS